MKITLISQEMSSQYGVSTGTGQDVDRYVAIETPT